jgi:hypothetical protein
MKHTHAIACYVASVIALMFFAIVLNSCNTLRHYKKVAKDAPRSEAKRDILASVCAVEFPVVPKTDTLIETVTITDTSNERNLKAIIKQLAKQLSDRPECPQVNVDSLHDAIVSSIKPTIINKTKTVTNTVLDSAAMHIAQNKYDDLLKQHDDSVKVLVDIREDYEELKANTNSSKWLLKQFLKLNWWWMLLLSLAITAIIILLKKARLI